MHLARAERQIDPAQDRLVLGFKLDVQIGDLQHFLSCKAVPSAGR